MMHTTVIQVTAKKKEVLATTTIHEVRKCIILSAAGEKTIGIKLLSLEAAITIQELLFQYSVLRNILKSKANYLQSEKIWFCG